MKTKDIDEIKKRIYTGMIFIDDPIDRYSKHTLLHDAIMMNQVDLVKFLLMNGANPMVRDANGYTPLLKAAAMGRNEVVRILIDEYKVDPRHKDPYGITA